MSTYTGALRNYFAVAMVSTKKEAGKALGLTPAQTKSAFDNLVKSGHIKRISRGTYQFLTEREGPHNKGEDKIWRAMDISTTFSAADISKLANSSRDYVYRRLREYLADGWIKPAGRKNTYGSGSVQLYRLTQKGKLKAKKPNIQIHKPHPLHEAAARLNLLICSDLAIRSQEAADEAFRFMEIIKKGLEDAATS